MLRVIDDSDEDYLYPATSFHLLNKADSVVLARSLGKLAA